MNVYLGIITTIAVIALVAVITALAVGAIKRDSGRHGTSGSLSAAALEIQSLLEPEKKKVVETMRAMEEREHEDESGEE